MNFRSCRYFLTVCEMSTISAAANRLYISQQSLSQHIRHMEKELGVQLFHRDNPLTLTDAGKCVRRTAERVLAAMDDMDRELARIRNVLPNELIIGMLDYGTPNFVPPLIEAFLEKEQNVLIRTVQIAAGEQPPPDARLLFAAREAGPEYTSELLFSDRLVVLASDVLLRQRYPGGWEARKRRLAKGDITALDGCPFILPPQSTPLHNLMDRLTESADFSPSFLPVMGDMSILMHLCGDGQAAMISFLGIAQRMEDSPPWYPIASFPDPLPTGYICYRKGDVLPAPAQRFLELSRRFLKRYGTS